MDNVPVFRMLATNRDKQVNEIYFHFIPAIAA